MPHGHFAMLNSRNQRLRVLLLNPPFKHRVLRDFYCCTYSKTGYLWHPIDLLAQSGILGARHEVSVCDAMALGMTRKSALDAAANFNPDAVYSLIGSLTLESDLAFIEELYRRDGAKIIVSGDAVLNKPEFLLETHPSIHAALFNFTNQDLLNILEANTDSVRDAAFKTQRGIEVRRMGGASEFQYPVPNHAAFNHNAYNMPLAPQEFVTILTAFGCPHSCAFCNSGVRSLGFSLRRIENVEQEIAHVHSQGIRHIFFKDMTFGIGKERTGRLCEYLVRNAPGTTWHAYTRLDLLDEHTITMFARSGCRLLQLGIETADPRVGSASRKPLDLSRAANTFKIMRREGITPGAHFIMGLPRATLMSDIRTMRRAAALNPGYASFNAFMPRPGSEWFEKGQNRARSGFALKMLVRAAYLYFYCRPRSLVAFFSRTASMRRGQSLSAMLRYLIFVPDLKRRGAGSGK